MPGAEDATASTSRATRTAQPDSAASASCAGPKTRQRIHKPPEPLAVPDIEEDAAERKRAGSALQASGDGADGADMGTASEQMVGMGELSAGLGGSIDMIDVSSMDPGLDGAVPFADLVGAAPTMGELGVPTTTLGDLDLSSNNMTLAEFQFDLSLSTSLATMAAAKASASGSWDLGTSNSIVATSAPSPPSPSAGINPLLLRGSVYHDNSGSSLAMSTSSQSYTFSSSSSVTDHHLSPDSYLLPVAELTLLRAVMRISARLGCTEALWQIDGQSPFLISNQKRTSKSGGSGSGVGEDDGDDSDNNSDTELAARSRASVEASVALLPPNWRPTHAQRFLPHHPALDILPWPSVREKIIGLFNLPLHERPPIAADPLALVHFIYDLEDNAEGLRIWGSDPYDPTCWEVGQLVFERWWFLFDREIIEQSNRWRDMRGASRLRAASTDTRTKGVMDMI
ncbi:hypothetical protein SCUCBS95973_004355 [Sporothrix curviconia]|uniref:Uncharacterized protein n=1 Tax=Sporothrix curviconia TaxID=1260050 RepID=A0ABP0BN09_9PEZI